MFEPRRTARFEEQFLARVEEGKVADYDICYCRTEFDASRYSDDAFAQYGVTLPPHIARAVIKRRTEYLAGRICCKHVLETLGITQEVGTAYPEREPVWPAGVAGSISHCGSSAIAVITTERHGHVGIDIEEVNNSLIEAHADAFTTPEERQRVRGAADLLVIFSAKEALFKALYPTLKKYFGFECARVSILSETRFSVELTCSLGPGFPAYRSWTGQYCLDACVVTTLLVDQNPTSSSG